MKAWAATQDERRLYISILTLGEYDKGISHLTQDHPHRSRYVAARDALQARFIISVTDGVVRRWGQISGLVKNLTGHAPSVVDTLLASALELDLILATRNIKDVRYSGAVVFNPWQDDPAEFPLA